MHRLEFDNGAIWACHLFIAIALFQIDHIRAG